MTDVTETVMEVTKSRQMAEIKLVHYASAIKAMEAADRMGVKLKQVQGVWQIVLVDRKWED
jgi:hypothetical protein